MSIVYNLKEGKLAEYERIASLINFAASEGDKLCHRVLAELIRVKFTGKEAFEISSYLKSEFYTTTFASSLNEGYRKKKLQALKVVIDFLSFTIQRAEAKREEEGAA